MVKTEAQRLARARRRKARNLSRKSAPQAVQGQKRLVKRARKRQMGLQMRGPGPSSVIAKTGRIGLGMNSGSRPGATNRRQKICEEDEFIANVTGSAGTSSFTISNTIAVNPGLVDSFPWLSAEASRYNEYEWEYLEYYYKRTGSEFAPANLQGKVLLFFNPDASDIPPTTKQQIEDSVYHNDGMPCDPMIRLPVDCRRLRGNLARFVRESAPPANTDIKTYDAGNLYCAADSTATSGTIGELRVRYRIKFTVPKLGPEDLVFGTDSIHIKIYSNDAAQGSELGLTPYTTGSPASTGVTVSGTAPGSTLSVINMGGDLDLYTSSTIGLNDAADTTLNLPNSDATWICIAQWTGAASIAGIPTVTVAGGATLLSTNFGTLPGLGFFLAAGTSCMIHSVITTTEQSTKTINTNSVVWGTNAMASGNVDVYIVRVPDAQITITDKTLEAECHALALRADAQDRKISELVRLLTHCSSPEPGDTPQLVDDSSSSPPVLSDSIHIPKGLLAKYLSGSK